MTKNGIVILSWLNKILSRIGVTNISVCTQAAGKTDVMVIHYDYMYTLTFIGAVQEDDEHRDLSQVDDILSTAESPVVVEEDLKGQEDKRY